MLVHFSQLGAASTEEVWGRGTEKAGGCPQALQLLGSRCGVLVKKSRGATLLCILPD